MRIVASNLYKEFTDHVALIDLFILYTALSSRRDEKDNLLGNGGVV